MPGPVARSMTLRRGDTAKRLLPAVEELLQSGARFRDLSVEALCAAAGLARSTFYIHFEDKGHLLQVLGAEAVEDLLSYAALWPTMAPDADRAAFTAIITDLLNCYTRHARLIEALTEESVHDRRVRREFQRLYDVGHGLLVTHIQEGQAGGSVRIDVDPDSTVPWLLAMLDRGFYLLLRRPEADLPAQARAVASIIWRALYAETRTRPPS